MGKGRRSTPCHSWWLRTAASGLKWQPFEGSHVHARLCVRCTKVGERRSAKQVSWYALQTAVVASSPVEHDPPVHASWVSHATGWISAMLGRAELEGTQRPSV